jgi:hypothetical protein
VRAQWNSILGQVKFDLILISLMAIGLAVVSFVARSFLNENAKATEHPCRKLF